MREYLLEHHKSDLATCGMESCDNFEHVMETTLQLCILRPLSHYVYLRIEEYYTSNGFLYQVQRSIQQGKLKKQEEFGIRVRMKMLTVRLLPISSYMYMYIIYLYPYVYVLLKRL